MGNKQKHSKVGEFKNGEQKLNQTHFLELAEGHFSLIIKAYEELGEELLLLEEDTEIGELGVIGATENWLELGRCVASLRSLMRSYFK